MLKAQHTIMMCKVHCIAVMHKVPFSMPLQVAGGPGTVSVVHSVQQLKWTGVFQWYRLHARED